MVARGSDPLAPTPGAAQPGYIAWLSSQMIKTRVAHGDCWCHLAAEACADADICENCDKLPDRRHVPAAAASPPSSPTRRPCANDAERPGWDNESHELS